MQAKRVPMATGGRYPRPVDVALAISAGLGFAALWLATPLLAPHVDFHINFLGAAALRAGLNPYDFHSLRAMATAMGETLDATRYSGAFERYIQPPFSALLIAPLVPLGDEAGFALYYAVNLALTLVALGLGLALAGWSGAAWRWLAGCVFAWPAIFSLALGQVDGFICAALALSAWALTRRPHGEALLAGLPLGVAAGIKPVPAVFLLYLLATRRLRAFAWGLAGGLLALLLPALLFGPHTTTLAFLQALPTLAGGSGRAESISVPGLIARLYIGPSGLDALDAVSLPPALAALSALSSLGLLAWALWRARQETPTHAYLVLAGATVLASTVAWEHYATWLLPFLIPWLAGSSSQRPRSVYVLALAGVLLAYAPLTTLYVLGLASPLVPFRQAGLVLLLLAARWPHRDERRQAWGRLTQ